MADQSIGTGGRLPGVEDILLSAVVTVDLSAVVELDAFDELVEQIDELHGGLVGKVGQTEAHNYGGIAGFHWISSIALWTCSELICLSLASAAADSA